MLASPRLVEGGEVIFLHVDHVEKDRHLLTVLREYAEADGYEPNSGPGNHLSILS